MTRTQTRKCYSLRMFSTHKGRTTSISMLVLMSRGNPFKSINSVCTGIPSLRTQTRLLHTNWVWTILLLIYAAASIPRNHPRKWSICSPRPLPGGTILYSTDRSTTISCTRWTSTTTFPLHLMCLAWMWRLIFTLVCQICTYRSKTTSSERSCLLQPTCRISVNWKSIAPSVRLSVYTMILRLGGGIASLQLFIRYARLSHRSGGVIWWVGGGISSYILNSGRVALRVAPPQRGPILLPAAHPLLLLSILPLILIFLTLL